MKRLRQRVTCYVISGALLALVQVESAHAEDIDKLYIVNSLSESMTTIDRVAGTVQLTTVNLGLIPNRVRLAHDSLLLVVHSGSASLWVYGLPEVALRRTIALPAGSNPWDAVVWDDSLCAVSLVLENRIVWVNFLNGSVVGGDPVGKSPQGLLVANGRLTVANTGFDFGTFLYDPGTVTVLSGPGEPAPVTVPVGLNPQMPALAPDGSVHVLCTGDFFSVFGAVYRVDPVSLDVDSLIVGGSPGDLVVDVHGVGYLAAGGWRPGPGLVYRYDAATFAALNDAGNPWIVPDSGVIAVWPRLEGGVYALDFDGDAVSELDKAGVEVRKWLVGDGPAAVAQWTNRMAGNTNEMWPVDVLDVVDLIDFVFRSGPALERPSSGDVNGDCVIDVLDVTVLIDWVFRSGPPVVWGCA